MLQFINNLDNIKVHGLSGKFTKVRPGEIHLGIDINIVEGYHCHWENTDTIIFAINTSNLCLELLGPDREDLMEILEQNNDPRDWGDIKWKESLLLSGNCTYNGNIPFNLLKIEKIIEFGSPVFSY